MYFHTRSKPCSHWLACLCLLLRKTSSSTSRGANLEPSTAHTHTHIFLHANQQVWAKVLSTPDGWTIDGRSFPQWLWSVLGCGEAKPVWVLPQYFRPKLGTHMWGSVGGCSARKARLGVGWYACSSNRNIKICTQFDYGNPTFYTFYINHTEPHGN